METDVETFFPVELAGKYMNIWVRCIKQCSGFSAGVSPVTTKGPSSK